MERVARFEKVSADQFRAAMQKVFEPMEFVDEDGNPEDQDTEFLNEAIQRTYENLQLPTRATRFSSGYDFKAPFRFVLASGESLMIPTGIRAVFTDMSYCLLMIPRSSQGVKYGIRFSNTAGNIDADYSGAENEGHIYIKLENWGAEDYIAEPGDKIAQGIFLPYGITEDDSADGERTGGMGSTGR